jgi:hypothetical protein
MIARLIYKFTLQITRVDITTLDRNLDVPPMEMKLASSI